MVSKYKSLWVFLFKKKFISLLVKFFNGRSSSIIFCASVKILMCGFKKIELELEETNTFILAER